MLANIETNCVCLLFGAEHGTWQHSMHIFYRAFLLKTTAVAQNRAMKANPRSQVMSHKTKTIRVKLDEAGGNVG